MTAKWSRAVFMILLGLVLLIYGDGFVTDLETNASEEWNMSFEWTWDLLTYLIWILIAWLFVGAVLAIVLSLRADAYNLSDVMDRLDSLEKRLGREKVVQGPASEREDYGTSDDDGDEPPPPRE
jgi:hypothetical protein